MKKIAILQSNYIPWKGYFDLIRSVDEFVLLNDVQYTRRDWRNRNIIKTPNGLKWLTIPVKTKGRYSQLISETKIDGSEWAENHLKIINNNYSKGLFFKEYKDQIADAYNKAGRLHLLTEVNKLFIDLVCSILNIKTRITKSTDYLVIGKRYERIISICKQAGADVYITGPSALNYINVEEMKDEGINIVVADYSKYPLYEQLYGQFSNNVSVLDLIFNTGRKSTDYMIKF